jgi:tripartite-type tricarboxylate transporter receptor subunit TctC
MTRRFAAAFAAAARFACATAMLFAVAAAAAETYPARTVTIIVPYPAGGPTDTTAREIANGLAAAFKQSVIVENVTGGGTTVATNKVARAAPDGYTLLLHNLQISANATLYKNLPFDTERDLTPVILVNKNPLILVGRKSLPANNLAELLALMKTQTLKAAIPGYGATGHLTTTLLAQQAKVSLDQIPYRGAAPAMTDLLGGHVDLFFGTPQSVIPHVTAGKLKAYAITAKAKNPKLPTADSLVDALGPKFDIVYWQGLFAPAGTPASVIEALNAALKGVVTDKALLERWAVEGFEPFPQSQLTLAAARAFMHAEVGRWGEVIRDNDIKVEQ